MTLLNAAASQKEHYFVTLEYLQSTLIWTSFSQRQFWLCFVIPYVKITSLFLDDGWKMEKYSKETVNCAGIYWDNFLFNIK